MIGSMRIVKKIVKKNIGKTKTDSVENFLAVRNRLPKLTDKQIFTAIRRGRM